MSETIPIQIEDKHFALVLDILQTHLDSEVSVYAFGSRAKNKAQRYSDLDLAVDYHHEPLPMKTSVKLLTAFEESLLPFRVDVVDLAAVSTSFKGMIADDLIRVF